MEAVCSRALRLKDAILVPRQASPISCILHAICELTPPAEAPLLDRGESQDEVTQYAEEYIDEGLGGEPFMPLDMRDDTGPLLLRLSPPMLPAGFCRDCMVWRGPREGGIK